MKEGDRVSVVGDGEIVPLNPPNAFIRKIKGPNQFLITDTRDDEYTWGAWMERDEIAPVVESFWKRRFRIGTKNNHVEMPIYGWIAISVLIGLLLIVRNL